jgi:phospholipid N-methyltransferase
MKITNEVREVLESGIRIDGDFVVITAQLDRKLYVKVNEVLEALGGKWKRSAKAHVFVGDAGDLIEQALLHGEVTTDRDAGFFPTPRVLADEMARWVVPNATALVTVLEPSAGSGVLIDAVMFQRESARVVALEWDDKRRQALTVWHRENPRIQIFPDSDFLEFEPAQRYAAIIANPPFCKVGLGDHLDHLHHMLALLAPRGRLACVMPASLMFRQDKRYAATRASVSFCSGTITPLPAGTFKEAGTMVNTCLVKIGAAP